MTKPIFETEVENTLWDTTEWDEHQALIVGVYELYTFNNTQIQGLVAIQQPGGDELEEWREQGDFRDNTCDEIQMTAATARLLAEALLRAADAVDTSGNRKPEQG